MPVVQCSSNPCLDYIKPSRVSSWPPDEETEVPLNDGFVKLTFCSAAQNAQWKDQTRKVILLGFVYMLTTDVRMCLRV